MRDVRENAFYILSQQHKLTLGRDGCSARNFNETTWYIFQIFSRYHFFVLKRRSAFTIMCHEQSVLSALKLQQRKPAFLFENMQHASNLFCFLTLQPSAQPMRSGLCHQEWYWAPGSQVTIPTARHAPGCYTYFQVKCVMSRCNELCRAVCFLGSFKMWFMELYA